jgi:hypothetical protein
VLQACINQIMVNCKDILKYLRRTNKVFLVFGGKEELVVTGYTNASFQIDTMILNHNPVLCSASMEGS